MSRIFRALMLLLSGDSAGKYRVKQEIAYRLANLWGDFPFSDGPQIWRRDKTFLDDYKRLSPNSQFSSDRKFMLAELMRAVEHLPGDVVECGSYQGASAYFLAKNSKAKIHLIDSFEGLSDPSSLDVANDSGARQWIKGDMCSQLSVIKNNLAEFSQVIFHKVGFQKFLLTPISRNVS
ncbi:MAG: hypothetical protein U5M23_13205 [Marinagarivorans sp.]|nr:hypothetical protein [Marinagarivorans sp.]